MTNETCLQNHLFEQITKCKHNKFYYFKDQENTLLSPSYFLTSYLFFSFLINFYSNVIGEFFVDGTSIWYTCFNYGIHYEFIETVLILFFLSYINHQTTLKYVPARYMSILAARRDLQCYPQHLHIPIKDITKN